MTVYLIQLSHGEFFGGYSEHHELLIRIPKDRPFEALIYPDPHFAQHICDQLTNDQGRRVKGKVVPFYFGPMKCDEDLAQQNSATSPDKVFDKICNWNGLSEYGPMIRRWVRSVYGIELK